jgi:hypothetical protein
MVSTKILEMKWIWGDLSRILEYTALLHEQGEGDGKKLPLTFEGWMMFR